jgi:hypothetical protein
MIALLCRSRPPKCFECNSQAGLPERMYDGEAPVRDARQPPDKAGTFLTCAEKYAESAFLEDSIVARSFGD